MTKVDDRAVQTLRTRRAGTAGDTAVTLAELYGPNDETTEDSR